MKKVVISLLLLIMATAIYSQELEGMAGFFRIGYTHSSAVSKTMSAIAGNGITGFSDDFILVGAEINYRYDPDVIIIEGYIASQDNCSNENRYAEPFIVAGHLKYGRVICCGSNYWVYPAIGGGASMTGLTTYEKINGESTAKENVSVFSPSFDVSLSGNLLFAKREQLEKSYGGLIMGCRIGYHTSFKNDHWYNDSGSRVANMPSYSNKGFYVTLAIGAGGFRKIHSR
jgi:hypothetical protein